MVTVQSTVDTGHEVKKNSQKNFFNYNWLRPIKYLGCLLAGHFPLELRAFKLFKYKLKSEEREKSYFAVFVCHFCLKER